MKLHIMFGVVLLLHLLGATVWTGGHLILATVILPRALKHSDVEGIRNFENAYERIGIPALIVQIATHYQLVIPFANGVIWHIVAGTQKAELMRTIRLAPKNDQFQPYMQSLQSVNHGQRKIEQFRGMANNNKYVIPIRASWSMRMQSNFLNTNNDFKLPTKNLCHVPWEMKDKS